MDIFSNHIFIFFASFALFYIYHCLGITLGYHRLLSHRSLVVPKWMEYFIVSGGYLAFEGSPIFWVSTHRLHHRFSDSKGDPHSPLDGLWHAFIAWMWNPKVIISLEESQKQAPDLYRDPIYRFLHCRHSIWDGYLCLLIGVLFRVALFLSCGIWILLGNLAATALAFCGPLLVNSISHLRQFGYETYPCGDNSRNVWFVAALSMGEGWHNNHHAFPQSARHGLKTTEFDFTWLTICLLEKLKIAHSIRLAKPDNKVNLKKDAEPAGKR
ncbi:acyl-CoA desaturase [bacterium]|nr:acyl-CoA desaturase [bacterium]